MAHEAKIVYCQCGMMQTVPSFVIKNDVATFAVALCGNPLYALGTSCGICQH
jgi:hypothetical protein